MEKIQDIWGNATYNTNLNEFSLRETLRNIVKNRPTENTQCEHYIFIIFKALRLAVILYDATQARSV